MSKNSKQSKFNIVCVKVDSNPVKYTSEHVNQIYRMARDKSSLPFNMFVFTNDSRHIDSEINCIQNESSLKLDKWWWKVCIFDLDLPDLPTLYIDLDVVIQRDISTLALKADRGLLRTIYSIGEPCIKKPDDTNYPPSFINSSLMAFYPKDHKYIKDHLLDNPHMIDKYFGLDRYLTFNHMTNINKFDWFGDYYFRDATKQPFHDPCTITQIPLENGKIFTARHLPNYTTCVLTNVKNNLVYKGLEEYLL